MPDIDHTDRYAPIRKLGQYLFNEGFFRNCLNCDYWRDPETVPAPHGCEKHRQMPPHRIVVAGCSDHTDLIPF